MCVLCEACPGMTAIFSEFTREQHPQELEFVKRPTKVVGVKLWSFARAVQALDP